MPKQGTELGSVLFRDNSIATLLAICEFVAEQLGEKINEETMLLTIDALDKLFLEGEKRKKKNNSPNGRRGNERGDEKEA